MSGRPTIDADMTRTRARQDAAVEDWVVDGRTAGTWTTARNMTYVKILDASHMVRSDAFAWRA